MKIENQAQYDAADQRANQLMGKGGRLLALDNKLMFEMPMTESEKTERHALMAEYEELTSAMREYNSPAMQRIINGLNAD